MAKHSEGPWISRGHGAIVGGPEIEFARGKGRRQIVMVCQTGEMDPAEYEANVALVTAAPHLLEMVRQYASECSNCNAGGKICTGTSGLESDGNAPILEQCEDCMGIRLLLDKAGG